MGLNHDLAHKSTNQQKTVAHNKRSTFILEVFNKKHHLLS